MYRILSIICLIISTIVTAHTQTFYFDRVVYSGKDTDNKTFRTYSERSGFISVDTTALLICIVSDYDEVCFPIIAPKVSADDDIYIGNELYFRINSERVILRMAFKRGDKLGWFEAFFWTKFYKI